MNPEILSGPARAKLNLFFEVHRRLDTGYHEIESFVTGISLADSLMVRRRAPMKASEVAAAEISQSAATVNLHGNAKSGNIVPMAFASQDGSLRFMVHIPSRRTMREMFTDTVIPVDERNLVIQAARALQHVAAEKIHNLPSADIVLTKRIPSQAGLGGGSSDAAATLTLLNDLWNLGLSQDALITLGSRFGCDVPLFLRRSPVICRGLGERVDEVPRGNELPTLYLVVLYPPVGLSTPDVYRACIPRETETGKTVPSGEAAERIAKLLAAWQVDDLPAIARQFFNRLLPAARTISPWISRIESCFRSLEDPCVGFSMTGSGSAFFGLCRDKAHARKTAASLEGSGVGRVFVVKTT